MKVLILVKRGTVGLITYMRTDSTRISDTAKLRQLPTLNPSMVKNSSPRSRSRLKASNAQDAHEAIRPTSTIRTPDELKQCLVATNCAYIV